MNNSEHIRAIQMGILARKALTEACTGTVLGLTSKGMFLNTNDRVLFITEADFKSPFNIQISSMALFEGTIKPADAWQYSDNRLIMGDKKFRVDTSGVPVWQPAAPAEINTELAERAARLGSILQRMQELDAGKGWLFLADPGSWFGDEEKTYIFNQTAAFLDAVETSDLQAALESGKHILGRGGGLTPSGDDWICGFLLYFTRLGKPPPLVSELGKSLTAMAFEQTTKISANRIEAACLGWAEEIFLDVLDHLYNDYQSFPDEKTIRLVNFGHSSGVDTCVGFYSALCSDLPVL